MLTFLLTERGTRPFEINGKHVIVAEVNMLIQPNSPIEIKTGIIPNFDQMEFVCVEIDDTYNNILYVENNIISVRKERLNLRITNLTDKEVSVNKGDRLCCFYALDISLMAYKQRELYNKRTEIINIQKARKEKKAKKSEKHEKGHPSELKRIPDYFGSSEADLTNNLDDENILSQAPQILSTSEIQNVSTTDPVLNVIGEEEILDMASQTTMPHTIVKGITEDTAMLTGRRMNHQDTSKQNVYIMKEPADQIISEGFEDFSKEDNYDVSSESSMDSPPGEPNSSDSKSEPNTNTESEQKNEPNTNTESKSEAKSDPNTSDSKSEQKKETKPKRKYVRKTKTST